MRLTPANRSLRATLLAIAVGALGGFVGWHLLGSANDASPAVLAALHASADPVQPRSASPARRVVIALFDGLGQDPLEALVARGELGPVDWHARIDVGAPSLSRPVYHVLLTGVSQPVSGVRNNRYAGRARADSLADRVHAAGDTVAWGLETVPWFHELFGRESDAFVRGASIASVRGFETLYGRGAALTVVHLVQTDHVGHAHGAASREYADTALASVRLVRAMHDAVATHPDHARTLWFVGADHGHMPRGGHGGPELEVRRTAWFGLFPARRGTAPVEVPGSNPVTRMAATFASALGVQTPLESLGEALPLPGIETPRGGTAAVREGHVRSAFERNAHDARRAMTIRALILGAVCLALVIVAIRRGRARDVFASSLVVAVAGLAWALAGPGLTLSAIRTHTSFIVHSVLVLAAGAAVALPIARRAGARVLNVLALSALPPVAAWIVTNGSLGRSVVDPVGALVYPATGLAPVGVAVGVAIVLALRRLRRPRAGAVTDRDAVESG